MQDLCRSDMWRHRDTVVHPLAFAPRGDDARFAQIGQMARYFGLGLIQNLYKVTDADLSISHEIQEPQTCIVAEGLKEAFHAERFLFRSHELNYIWFDEYIQREYSCFSEYVWRDHGGEFT